MTGVPYLSPEAAECRPAVDQDLLDLIFRFFGARPGLPGRMWDGGVGETDPVSSTGGPPLGGPITLGTFFKGTYLGLITPSDSLRCTPTPPRSHAATELT